ncbi:twin-arginine translocase TatA/TatE family subunit [Spirochaetota bacterium]
MTFPGWLEVVIIAVIIIVIFGGGKAISSMKNMGREIFKLKSEIDDIKNDIKKDIRK